MTRKLTKNDRLLKKHVNFDVIVASFEAFLNEKCVHGDYFQEWEVANHYQGTANVFYAWREWAKSQNPQSWIKGAYVWRNTQRGFHFWAYMNQVWINWYHRILKK